MPEQYATIDGGTRLFEERLTLGSKVSYIGDSVQTLGNDDYSIKLPAYTLLAPGRSPRGPRPFHGREQTN